MSSRSGRMRRRLLWGLAALVIVVMPAPTSPQPPAERHVRIEASSFSFAPAIIDVDVGARVTLELVATDVVHGLYIDGYDLRVTADPGQTTTLRFVADQPGTFRFRCSVSCGALHPFMMGKLRVGRNGLWWRAVALSLLVVVAGAWSARR